MPPLEPAEENRPCLPLLIAFAALVAVLPAVLPWTARAETGITTALQEWSTTIEGYTKEGGSSDLEIDVNPQMRRAREVRAELVWVDEAEPSILFTNLPDTFSVTLYAPLNRTAPVKGDPGSGGVAEAVAASEVLSAREEWSGTWRVTVVAVDCGDTVSLTGWRIVTDEGNAWTLTFTVIYQTSSGDLSDQVVPTLSAWGCCLSLALAPLLALLGALVPAYALWTRAHTREHILPELGWRPLAPKGLAWGALFVVLGAISVIGAVVVEGALTLALTLAGADPATVEVTGLLMAGPVEEGAKALMALCGFIIWGLIGRRPAGRREGMFAGAVVGALFGLTESVLYLLSNIYQAVVDPQILLLDMIVWRVLLGAAFHALLCAVASATFGGPGPWPRRSCWIALSVAAAAAVHSLFNAITLLDGAGPSLGALAVVDVLQAGTVAVIALCARALWRRAPAPAASHAATSGPRPARSPGSN